MPITDFAIQLPAAQRTSHDISRRAHLDEAVVRAVLPAGRLSVLDEDEEIWTLAARAAGEVLRRNDVRLSDVGVVVWAGSSEWGRPFWSPAAKVAQLLGVNDAWCFEMSNFCNAGMGAIAAVDRDVRDGRYRAALVIVADRLSQLVDYESGYVELFNFADAAAAVLVQPQPGIAVRGFAASTEPRWVDHYYGEVKDSTVKVQRSATPDGLGEAFTDNFVRLTGRALEQAQLGMDDVARVLVTQGNRNLQVDYLDALGVDHTRSVFDYDREGHLGGVDPFTALNRLQTENSLRVGDVVLVATAGSGFSWAVTVLEVQRVPAITNSA